MIARKGLSAIINAQKDMTVIVEATNGQEAVKLYRRHLPDVTLMDLRMPFMKGFEAVATIRADFSDARFIAISTFGGDEDVRRALMVGVQAYLTKDVLNDELIKAIRAVYAGQTYLPAAVSATLRAHASQAALTKREIQILELITQGFGNKQIAFKVGIANYTVHNHVKSISISWALRTGLKQPLPQSCGASFIFRISTDQSFGVLDHRQSQRVRS